MLKADCEFLSLYISVLQPLSFSGSEDSSHFHFPLGSVTFAKFSAPQETVCRYLSLLAIPMVTTFLIFLISIHLPTPREFKFFYMPLFIHPVMNFAYLLSWVSSTHIQIDVSEHGPCINLCINC